MKLADQIWCTFGGGGGDAASSTAPIGQHPETDGTWGREKMRKGGPDKGGVEAQQITNPDTKEFIQKTKPQLIAGGPGSGCNGPDCGRPRKGFSGEVILEHLGLSRAQWEALSDGQRKHLLELAQKELRRKARYAKKKGLKSAGKKMKRRSALKATSGGQSEGSSLTARKFYVVDGQGRVLHTFRTRKEAEQASAGNRYTRVVTHVEQDTPMSDTPEVRDMVRKRLVSPVQTFRRSLPFPGSPFPGSPQGR